MSTRSNQEHIDEAEHQISALKDKIVENNQNSN